MTAKNQLSLSNILQNFKQAQSDEQTKTASDEPAENDVAAQEDPTKTAETVDAGADVEETADVAALKKIAQEAIEKEDESMQKEAEEFGSLFAHGFLQELEKVAKIDAAYDGAYQATTQAFKDEARNIKLAEIHDEAYHNTIADIARRQTYHITQAHLREKTAGELPLVLAGVTGEAYDATLEVLNKLAAAEAEA